MAMKEKRRTRRMVEAEDSSDGEAPAEVPRATSRRCVRDAADARCAPLLVATLCLSLCRVPASSRSGSSEEEDGTSSEVPRLP